MKNNSRYSESKLTPEKALSILRGEGLEVNYDQAKLILEFLRKLANIAVSNHLR